MDDQDRIDLQKLVEGGPQPDCGETSQHPALPRDAQGRFLAGGPGRPLGARNRISRRIGLALLRHYEGNEPEILSRLMSLSHFPIYMRLVGRMLPQGPLEDDLDLSAFSPEDLEQAACAVRDALELARQSEHERAQEQQRSQERLEALLANMRRRRSTLK
jgi:hypothetical protein